MNYTDITENTSIQSDVESYLSNPDNSDLYRLNTLDPIPEEPADPDSICVLASDDQSAEPKDDNKYFLVSNSLSELITDFQRQEARKNLGIADKYTMTWGNITGNLVNQTDIYNFIRSQDISYGNLIIGDLNKSLDYFNQLIKDMAEGLSGNVILFSVTPDHRIYSDNPEDVTVTWMYARDVTSQKINGIQIDSTERSYTFHNISAQFQISLKYVLNSVEYTKTVSFQTMYPIYYGVSSDYEQDAITLSDTFSVTAGSDEYIYAIVSKPGTFTISGLTGGFEQISTLEISGMTYYVYKSTNMNLGNTKITFTGI